MRGSHTWLSDGVLRGWSGSFPEHRVTRPYSPSATTALLPRKQQSPGRKSRAGFIRPFSSQGMEWHTLTGSSRLEASACVPAIPLVPDLQGRRVLHSCKPQFPHWHIAAESTVLSQQQQDPGAECPLQWNSLCSTDHHIRI